MEKRSLDYELEKLESGLQLITVPMTSTNTATILVLVGTGSRHEAKEVAGISHFLEHMMFKGTKKRPGTMDITKELDGIGASYNAFTSHDYTGYYIKSSVEDFDLSLDVISDIFLNSVILEEEVQKERHVIVEEMNMIRDVPQQYVHDLFQSLLYGDQPLGRDIIGTKETVLGMKQTQFRDYFNSHYVAENTIVVVAGNIDSASVQAKLRGVFSGVRHGQALEPAKVVENQARPMIESDYRKTDQTHFILGFKSFGWFDDRDHIASVLVNILGGGMSSRLWSEVREKRGLAYYVRAEESNHADTGSIMASAGVNNERFHEAIEVILNEFKRLKEQPVGEAELQKAKSSIRGRQAIGLEGSQSVASYFADQQLLQKKIETPEALIGRINLVTARDIQKLAQEIFVPEKLNLALIGPFKAGDLRLNEILQAW
ncbi:MAG: hypothetical protein COV31_03070 [Candidatus Yanofskybacteria bacterium CG10_big_fil_rev_8_21_14_0_10_46_23]|uniref:Peptidase M16 n=1 Tax=Candidatus Yanofskybacteria bacterium CG10_big_fil_rev_8_21_14_0_10_46_23 TaxID=1975098 RepID=A0A2H0R3L8_9BACT|nr:MAG: hypothetical protein COV31_03070 [Candidatus Yanofskybacteria bacterium CG10_big_fil_rev_8_21_14_0_10_46_23]